MTIKAQVRQTLKSHPETRDDDRLLIVEIFRKKGLETLLGTRAYMDFVEFYMTAPCVESIRRSRQLIMAEG